MKHSIFFILIIFFFASSIACKKPEAKNEKFVNKELIVQTIEGDDASCNTYLIAKGGEASIIDAGTKFDKIANIIKQNGLSVKYIFLTHAHWDHIDNLSVYKKELNPIIALHKADLELFNERKGRKAPDTLLIGGEKFKLGDLDLEIINSNGHTKGGISIIFANHIFTGDALFKETIGRTDLPGGSYDDLIKSIKANLLTLPDSTIIHPGHGESSSIGDEKQYNPFLK